MKSTNINIALDIASPSEVFANILKKHQKRDNEIDQKIEIFNQNKTDFNKESQPLINNFNKEFSNIKEKLIDEKNKLMLSGPI